MSAAAFTLVILGAAATPATPAIAKAAPAHPPDITFEVRSYGERPTELIELFVPMLAKYHFGERRPRPKSEYGIYQAIFVGPDDDYLIATGVFNCVILSYYVSYLRKQASSDVAIDRVGTFRQRLTGFISVLPTPRLTYIEGRTQGKRRCDRAS